jgi:uncharacterized protein (DUF934 family)
MLIRLRDGAFTQAEDDFVDLADDAPTPAEGGVILSLQRFQSEGEGLLDDGRRLGVRLDPGQRVEDLAYDLPRLALVALVFPKFRDGRPYSSAMLLRRRFGFQGEIRASGDVLRDQAFEMARCGFDAFAPADGAGAADWAAAAGAFRHVYQRAADGRSPAFAERGPDHGL